MLKRSCHHVIKKKKYWPKHIDGDAIESHMAGRSVGITECRRGKMNGHYSHTHSYNDSTCNCKYAATYGTNNLHGNGYRGLYALLLDIRIVHKLNCESHYPKGNNDGGSGMFELRNMVREAEKSQLSISNVLRRSARSDHKGAGAEFNDQLNSTGTVENPRLCPTGGGLWPGIPINSAEDMPASQQSLKEHNLFMAKQLRLLGDTKAPGVDGIPNAILQALLRLEKKEGAEILVRSCVALDGDCLHQPENAKLLKIIRRGGGCCFENPKKPGRYRILEQPTWLLALYCKRATSLTKAAPCNQMEPFQFGLSSVGKCPCH